MAGTRKRIIFALVPVFLSCFHTQADTLLNVENYDKDANGRLNQSEAETFFTHQLGLPESLIYDRNQNLQIDDSILEGLPESIQSSLIEQFRKKIETGQNAYTEWLRLNNKEEGSEISLEEAQAYFTKPETLSTSLSAQQPSQDDNESQNSDQSQSQNQNQSVNQNKTPKINRFPFALADRARHLNIFDKEGAFNKQKSAQFRYTSDDVSEESSLSASGAIYWNSDLGHKVDINSSTGSLNRYGFSATFNRLKSNVERKERNALDFRATYYWNFQAGAKKSRHSISTSLLHSTDFYFESETNGIEAGYSLQNDNAFLGNPASTTLGVFEINAHPGIIWAKVREPQPGSKAEAGDEYLTAGGIVELSYWPNLILFGAQPSFNMEYTAYEGISGDRESSDLWKLSFEYPLSTHVAITANRENGIEYISQNEVKYTTIGLGLKL